jgi:acyl-coenzyme A synthetase/AMP-(fatty) acid ligase
VTASAVASGRFDLTGADLDADPFGFRSQVGRSARATLRSDDAAVIAAALRVLEGWAAEVHLTPHGVAAAPGSVLLDAEQLVDHLIPGSSAETSAEPTRWVLYTSGTTGEPKPIVHTLASLSRTVVRSEAAATLVWGLMYDPNRMAGLQVVLQSLAAGSRLVAPSIDDPLPRRIDRLVDGGVTALSATPTLWRRILQLPVAHDLTLAQITLGGEIADQSILDALSQRYPSARIVHVFASTETGAAFSVRDGRSGFPVSYLADAPKGIDLDIRDGILHVRSPGVSTAGPDGFASTGDIVEVVDDRVHFRGRASGVVNVGGANVFPEQVERLLRTHPDVRDALVTSVANALSGNLLVAQVVASDSVDTVGLGKRLRAFIRDQAPAAHVPATVKVVDELDMSTTGKAVRS